MILVYSIKNMSKRYITDLQKGKLGKNLKFLKSEILTHQGSLNITKGIEKGNLRKTPAIEKGKSKWLSVGHLVTSDFL